MTRYECCICHKFRWLFSDDRCADCTTLSDEQTSEEINEMKTKPTWGTAPIKCGNRKCDWTGTERDLIHHPEDIGKFSVRNVCPKCHCDNYTFSRRKRIHLCEMVTEITTPASA